jgi:CRISPR-associated endonuclease/helicase Cas3
MSKIEFKSHSDKLLIEHINGIIGLDPKNELLNIAAIFHDIGKLTDNFQKRLEGGYYVDVDGYTHHSYISAYYLINAFCNTKNDEYFSKYFSVIKNDDAILLLKLINVVVGHHTNLRNIKKIFNDDEWSTMIDYLKKHNLTERVNDFFKNYDILPIEFIDNIDNDNKNEIYKSCGTNASGVDELWRKDALNNYFDTLSIYSDLINADRRDASSNSECERNKKRISMMGALENNLAFQFNSFSKINTPLNNERTKIRNLAINNLKPLLKNDKNRVFTLTAPTGSGKTLMMLQLAVEILKQKNYEYDILYSLPYLSIIDQTVKIINNDLKINTLNYTSTSDTSEELQKLLEINDNYDEKKLIDYAFSENCFDHPFIVTTFNQLFETFLTNKPSKIIKLKNLKKRIILIDEFQAVEPTQYYVLMRLLCYFCEKYDSYAIICTATMPDFTVDFNDRKNINLKHLFKNEQKPLELLSSDVFKDKIFDRYQISSIGEVDASSLYSIISKSTKNTLLILNTIKTSQNMYNIFSKNKNNFNDVYLLNSNITPKDRKYIINKINEDLKNSEKTILVISTQVIEAGVDVSFPCLYRDCAPYSSIVQSNGRGNRNNEFGKINTYLFLYKDIENKYYDCDVVYQEMISTTFKNNIREKNINKSEYEFFLDTKYYFTLLKDSLTHLNLVGEILRGNFEEIGKYRLINDERDMITIFVGDNCDWNEYELLYKELLNSKTYEEREINRVKFNQIKGLIVQESVNVSKNKISSDLYNQLPVFGVYNLTNKNIYKGNIGLLFYL